MHATWTPRFTFWTTQELQQILHEAERYGRPGEELKWGTLFALLVNYGPRISEFLMLRPSAINWEKDEITIPTLKRSKWIKAADVKPHHQVRKEQIVVKNGQEITMVKVADLHPRTLPIFADVKPILARYVATLNGDALLFPGFTVNGRQVVWRAFQLICERAGVAKGRVHDLRHNFASRLYEATKDLPTIQYALGHASIATTAGYISALNVKNKLLKIPVITNGKEDVELKAIA